MSRYVVDTNVFVYARGTDHPYREPCRNVLRAALRGHVILEASVEVVQEFAHLLLRRGIDRSSALAEIAEVRALCHLHPFGDDVLDRATDLLGRYDHLGVRDAVHAATALSVGVGRLLSTDRVFDEVHEVVRSDPMDPSAPWAAHPRP